MMGGEGDGRNPWFLIRTQFNPISFSESDTNPVKGLFLVHQTVVLELPKSEIFVIDKGQKLWRNRSRHF